MKKRNPIARKMAEERRFRPKAIKNKKKYDRKKERRKQYGNWE